jgi:hypothetical protein
LRRGNTYVTTKHFLSTLGLGILRDLPDIETAEDAGLLSRHPIASADAPDDRSADISDFAD